jgi:LasA protease
LKLGKSVALRIKLAVSCWKTARRQPAHRLPAFFVLLIWGMVTLACSGGFITPAQLTATAKAPDQLVYAGNIQKLTLTPQASFTSPPPTTVAATLQSTLPPTRPVENTVVVNTTVAEPSATVRRPTPTEPIRSTQDSPILYYTQAGDTLRGLSARFNVKPEEITSPQSIPQEGLFDPGILLLIPPRLGEVSSSTPLIPDSEVVYSPSALDFELEKFIIESGGYLTSYKEWRSTGWHDGVKVIQRVAIENSINPRLLLAITERQSHWVYGQPKSLAETDFPIGWLRVENEKKGLYYQLSWAVQQLNIGYYGWRDGTVTELTFPDQHKLRLAPDLNAGTVSLLYLFSRLYNQPEWAGILYGPDGLMTLYENMFGNPWMRAQTVEPLFPATLTQPPLELPYLPGRTWSFTGGPHSAWGPDGARAALDFAPSSVTHGCYESKEFATAMASGLVVRSENGVVVLDLDGDGYEQTGWDIMYLHIATQDRIPLGAWANLNDPIGHPSCEGGVSTGTHTHIARKYNGEWILADGPMPFVLSGWRAHADKTLYKGTMTKDGKTAFSSTVGSFESLVNRPKTTP